jgi:hypothetical protein
MVQVTSLCTDCVQVMTNPICPKCFTRHISYWLRDKNLSQKELKEISLAMEEVIYEAEGSFTNTSCIVCGEKKVNLCTFCFTNRARKVLERSLKSKGTLDEFEENFDTIIWRI